MNFKEKPLKVFKDIRELLKLQIINFSIVKN